MGVKSFEFVQSPKKEASRNEKYFEQLLP
jgi:hypothetical protein